MWPNSCDGSYLKLFQSVRADSRAAAMTNHKVLSWFEGQKMEVSLCVVVLSVDSGGDETESWGPTADRTPESSFSLPAVQLWISYKRTRKEMRGRDWGLDTEGTHILRLTSQHGLHLRMWSSFRLWGSSSYQFYWNWAVVFYLRQNANISWLFPVGSLNGRKSQSNFYYQVI